ncbi:endonuclease/exonuclease/phosphatase family protein, partial [Ralstonia pseudosolanacearum]|nr:endonuclease/exonuclease/phosphatase family protein [Ralstonia pseudosolanacearum]
RVVVSHWPSRRTAAETMPVRMELGIALRTSLARMREDGSTPFHILMGDYNDDPFSPSLASHLLATRDRALARRDDEFFYNPFWRWIGESHDGLSNQQEDDSICGTHFYSEGETTRWFTYDQIIFSSAFLNDKSMVLNEQQSGILVLPELRSKLLTRGEIFDHLPVIGTVDLRSES